MYKIGIRPTIDRCQGVIRSSQEEETMALANEVASLITENIRDRFGRLVGCVIADTTIGSVAEAAECDEKFHKEGVCASITVTPSWYYATETMDMDPLIPKAIWGVNGTDRTGAIGMAAAIAAHAQKGLPVYTIYGKDVQDKYDSRIPEDVKPKLLRFARSAVAMAQMRNKSYLSIGTMSLGIVASVADPNFFEDYLGMRCEYCDMSEILRRLSNGIYDEEEFQRAIVWVRKKCKEGIDINVNKRSRQEKDKIWETVVKMTMIVRDIMIGNQKLVNRGEREAGLGKNAIAAGFQGAREWVDFMPNGDFLETMLNSSFDWNGIRTPYIIATENDSLNAASALFGYLISNAAQIISDVRTYWSPEAVKRVTGKELPGNCANGVIHILNSGPAALDATGQQERDGKPAMKPYWEITEEEADRCLEATKFCPVYEDEFAGGGFSTQFLSRGGMPMTMSRLNIVKGLGPVLQIAEGYSIDLPKDIHDIINERTAPTLPTTWFVPKLTGHGAFRDVYSVMQKWGANHAALSYGHIGADLITLASMLRIPVNMHNVEEKEIFRPTVWESFGTENLESADFRACSVYGPVYR